MAVVLFFTMGFLIVVTGLTYTGVSIYYMNKQKKAAKSATPSSAALSPK